MPLYSLARKFFSIFAFSCANPVPPLAKGETYDVLLSVWNVFRNREQREGFIRNGLSVHWIGNHYPPQKGTVTKRSFAWISFAIFMSAFFLKTKSFGIHASMWTFNLFSGTRRLHCKVVWAYVEMNPWLLKRAKKRGIPIILDNPIAHMEEYEKLEPEFKACGKTFPSWWVRRWVAAAKTEYSLSDYFNVGSEFVKRTLVSRGIPADRIFVNHTGVDTRLWAEAHRIRVETPPTHCIFVYTASITPRKGIQYLLRAWKSLSLPDSELWIVGGNETAMDWNLVCGGLPDRIRFFGRLNHQDLVTLYAKASVYVLPSLLEGFARSGLEAMAAGLPAIITEETGLTDFVVHDRNGWVVPSRDEKALRERLLWCSTHPNERKAAGIRAFDTLQGVTFDSYGDRCASIVKTILKNQNEKVLA